jgi:hypothetical protein
MGSDEQAHKEAQQFGLVLKSSWLIRIIAAFDWWYSNKRHDWFYSPIGGPPEPGVFGNMETLPMWPRWLCWLFTCHKVELKWADYMADVSGIRCRCAKIDRERPWDNSKPS